VRKNISDESWLVLIAAYVQTAALNKANMQVIDMLARYDVKTIIADSLSPLYTMVESKTKSASAEINNVIAREYNVRGPSIVKITDEELMSFLTMLQQEIQIRLHPPALGSAMVGAR
jgi:hypothetical protein